MPEPDTNVHPPVEGAHICGAHEACVTNIFNAIEKCVGRVQLMWIVGVLMCVGGAFGMWLMGRSDGVETQANKLTVDMAIIKTDVGYIKTTQTDIKTEQRKTREAIDRLILEVKNGSHP